MNRFWGPICFFLWGLALPGTAQARAHHDTLRVGTNIIALPDGGALVAGMYWHDNRAGWRRFSDDFYHSDGLFLTRYTENGTVRWSIARALPEATVTGLAVSEAGAIVVAGHQSLANGTEVFVLQFSENEGLQWEYWEPGNVRLVQMALDTTGNVVLMGEGDNGPWLRKLDTTGGGIWQAPLLERRYGYAYDMVVRDTGGVVLAGCTRNTSPYSGAHTFIRALDPNGLLKWHREITRTSDCPSYRRMALATRDGSGFFVVDGLTVFRYGWDGRRSWMKELAYYSTRLTHLASDPKQRVFAAGAIGENLVAFGMDATGTVAWDVDYVDEEHRFTMYSLNALLPDGEGGVIVAGSFSEHMYEHNSDDDYYVLRFDEDGTLRWRTEFKDWEESEEEEMDAERLLDAAMDDAGHIYLTGSSATVKLNAAGEILWATRYRPPYAISTEPEETSARGTMLHVWPQPVRNRAVLQYTLDRPARVSLRVYDVLGREIAVLGKSPSSKRAGGLRVRTKPAGPWTYYPRDCTFSGCWLTKWRRRNGSWLSGEVEAKALV